MIVYIGYGFNTTDLSKKDWVELCKKYDTKLFAEYAKGKSDDEIENGIIDLINENTMSPTDYLRDVICGTEYGESGIENVVSCYDNYIVFDSVRFANDSRRAQYILCATDFISMISKYVQTDHLAFGNLYESSSDYTDPTYFFD